MFMAGFMLNLNNYKQFLFQTSVLLVHIQIAFISKFTLIFSCLRIWNFIYASYIKFHILKPLVRHRLEKKFDNKKKCFLYRTGDI